MKQDIKEHFKRIKGGILVVIVVNNHLNCVKEALSNIFQALSIHTDLFLSIIDNFSDCSTRAYLNSLKHDRLDICYLGTNVGKAVAANSYINDRLSIDYMPRQIISLDPDTIFSMKSLSVLIEAVDALENVGMVGMRYVDGKTNPERNLFFKQKKHIGNNGKIYFLKEPFLCTVAGPIFGIKSKRLVEDMGFELFPKKIYRRYGGDDSATYEKLRWKYSNGYLEGTKALHLKSASYQCSQEEIDRFKETFYS